MYRDFLTVLSKWGRVDRAHATLLPYPYFYRAMLVLLLTHYLLCSLV